jgi:hypothetical protein
MVHRKKSTPLQESEGEEFSDNSASSKASSIDNPIEDGWVFPIVQPKAKRAEYEAVCQTKLFNVDIVELTTVSTTFQALKEAQLKVSDLQMTIRKLHMQNADLSMRLKESKSESNASSSGKKVRLSDLDLRISQFAKLFGVMHEPFVPLSALLVARPDRNSTHSSRYDSELSNVQGITAELYEVLPKEMHSDLKSSPKFRTMV